MARLDVVLETGYGSKTESVDLRNGQDQHLVLSPDVFVLQGTVFRDGEPHQAELEFTSITGSTASVSTNPDGTYEAILVEPVRFISVAFEDQPPFRDFFPYAIESSREMDFHLREDAFWSTTQRRPSPLEPGSPGTITRPCGSSQQGRRPREGRGRTEARRQAMEHLWSAIIHQGTPWAATGPVARVVGGLLLDDLPDGESDPLRAELTSFLVSVAEVAELSGWSREELERQVEVDVEAMLDSGDDEALFEDVEASNAYYAYSILGCARVTPLLTAVMLAGLANADPRVRVHASMGAVTLVGCRSMRAHAGGLAARLTELARAAPDTDERCSHVLALGDLGVTPAEFLDHPSPAVRLCAALAPSATVDTAPSDTATRDAAIAELLTALERHARSLDKWFDERPPQFRLQPRFAVVARLIERVEDFNRLADAAIAVVRMTSKYCVDEDWGPLLAAAFPDGSGTVETDAQRRFLQALVKQRKLWDPRFGNAHKWFKKAGLPEDRRACARLVRRFW